MNLRSVPRIGDAALTNSMELHLVRHSAHALATVLVYMTEKIQDVSAGSECLAKMTHSGCLQGTSLAGRDLRVSIRNHNCTEAGEFEVLLQAFCTILS